MKRALAALMFVPFLAGCPGQNVPSSWVEADRARFEAIAPEYRGYYTQDQSVDLAGKQRRDRTLELWEADVKAHEDAVRAGNGQ